MGFPDFAIIGAMKCGTSSLHEHLKLHPEISMSTPKEPGFFVESIAWGRGFAWYESIFPPGGRLRGESSTHYTKHPAFAGVPERLREANPDARLIYLLRDPIERIRSAWVHNVAQGRERRSFSAAIATPLDSPYVNISRFWMQIERWLAHFPREQIWVGTLDRLSAEPGAVLREVFAFLGVDPDFDCREFTRVHHDSGSKRRQTFLGRLTRRPRRIHRFLRRTVPRLVEAPIPRPVLSPEETARLTEILGPELARIESEFGVRVPPAGA